MCAIKRLVRLAIAVVGVAAVVLALLSSPAAADNHRKVGNTCGYSQDSDSNGGQKYEMKYIEKNGRLVCSDTNPDATPVPVDPNDLSKGYKGTWPITASTPSTPRTIKQVFGSVGSGLSGSALQNACITQMFKSAYLIPQTGTHADGTSTNTVFFDHRNANKKQTHREDDPVLAIDDLVAGEAFCSLKLF